MTGDRRDIPQPQDAGDHADLPPAPAHRPRAVIGLNLLTLWDDRGTLDDYIEPLREWAEAGRIRPLVAEVFPLERGADAHRYMQEGRNTGKVVLTV